MHRWVGAALSGALKPKPGLGNGEQKRFRMHIGVINTQNRFSFPFPLGFPLEIGPEKLAHEGSPMTRPITPEHRNPPPLGLYTKVRESRG